MSDSTQSGDPGDPHSGPAFRAGKAAARNRWILVTLGVITVIAGFVALAMPFVASITATLLLGWVLIVSGGIGLFSAFRRSERWQIAAAFALSLVAIVAGLLMLLAPLSGMLALTTIVTAYLGGAGAVRLYYGFRSLDDRGGWLIALGALSLLLALLLFFGLPYNAAWVPGVLLGIDLIFWGAAEIAFGLREGRERGTAEA